MRKRASCRLRNHAGRGGRSAGRRRHRRASPTSPVVGHTYVNDNAAGANTIAGFDRHADGSLTPIPGSPFATGGAGLGAGLGSQGAIQASPDGRFLLAVDAGSNQISVLRVGRSGVPHPGRGTGVLRRRRAGQHRRSTAFGLVYVANVGNGGSNYTGFFLTPLGTLIPLPYTTVAVPEGSGVGDVLFNSTGDRLVGTRDNTSLIDSFTVRLDGRLVPAAGSPFAGAEPRPDRLGVPTDQPVAALRLQRPRRRRSRHRVRVPGQPQRRPHVDRRLAGPRRPDRAVLGRDQPRRQVPVRRQHRLGEPVELRDPATTVRWYAARHARRSPTAPARSTPGSPRTARPCPSPVAAAWSSAPSPSTAAT